MTPGADFATMLATPNPTFDAAELAALARREWGLEGEVSELGSTQDQNARLRTAGGDFVLKIANRASTTLDLEVGDAAMARLGEGDVGFAVPAVVQTLRGARFAEHEGHLARLVTWVDGVPLADAGELDVEALRGLGTLAARCALGLAGFEHPGLDRALQWEPRQAPALADELLGSVADAERQAMVTAAMAPLAGLLASPAAAALPIQAVHCDITDYNVVATPDCSLCRYTGHKEQSGGTAAGERLEPSGLIDFGDVVASWRVTEAAHAAMSAVFHDLEDPLGGVGEVLGGLDAVAPLSPSEPDAVWPLILARAMVCALSSTHQAGLAGASPHLARLMAEDWTALEAVLAIPAPAATAATHSACAST